MVLGTQTGGISHQRFHNLVDHIRPGDLLVMNDSRVMKARLRGTRPATGAAVEVLLLHPTEISANSSRWAAFCRPAKKFRIGESLAFANGQLTACVVAEGAEGERILEFSSADILPILEQFGEIPLPPYIVQRRKETEAAVDMDDAERYQTVYARQGSSVAAPTAGLHFTPDLLEKISSKGARLAWVTLNVGAGTFKPVEVENPSDHPMHLEYYDVPKETAALIRQTKSADGRVIAVGTTTVRTLESAFDPEARSVTSGPHSTRLLILPGYRFQIVDAMVTNFHLPRSSLLMMISAFAGHDHVMNAYREAIAEGYRFYSYGDAMLIQ